MLPFVDWRRIGRWRRACAWRSSAPAAAAGCRRWRRGRSISPPSRRGPGWSCRSTHWEAPWRCCWWGSPRRASSSSGATGTPSAAQAAAAALCKGTVGSEESPVCMGRLEGTRTPLMMAAVCMARRRRRRARRPGSSCWMEPSLVVRALAWAWTNDPSTKAAIKSDLYI